MSRDVTTGPRDFGEQDARKQDSRMTLSQGRGGGSSDAEDIRRKPSQETLSELRTIIDHAAEDKPTVSEFLDRLEREHVTPMASIQTNGHWNGMVYQYKDVRVKGSQLGRPYTAQGLQERRGVRYDRAADSERLGRARMDRPTEEPKTTSRHPQIDPATRVRGTDGMTPAERAVLNDVGRFRTVAVRDLAHARYGGKGSLLERDVKRLVADGLLERRTLALDSRGRTATFLALTKRGKASLKRPSDTEGAGSQAIYHGFVKPREIPHDAGVYRMYLAEKEKIEREGGRIHRVVLDYELKKHAYSPLAKARGFPPGIRTTTAGDRR